jgi:hypothetical protein
MKEKRIADNERTSGGDSHLIVKWNLPGIAANLAAHLERLGEMGDAVLDSEKYLAPYDLSPKDEHTVIGLAWKVGCIDCGRLWDYYMVRDDVWEQAGLRPAQYCCRECLALRLKRSLRHDDFTRCLLNYEEGARVVALHQTGVDGSLASSDSARPGPRAVAHSARARSRSMWPGGWRCLRTSR